jgi:hypothetical protein
MKARKESLGEVAFHATRLHGPPRDWKNEPDAMKKLYRQIARAVEREVIRRRKLKCLR